MKDREGICRLKYNAITAAKKTCQTLRPLIPIPCMPPHPNSSATSLPSSLPPSLFHLPIAFTAVPPPSALAAW